MAYFTSPQVVKNEEKYKDYLGGAARYYTMAMRAEIKKQFPDLDAEKVDLNDPKFRDIARKVICPIRVSGDLSRSLGLDKVIVDEKILSHLFNGHCPTEVVPEDSHLRSYAVTPHEKIGSVIPLNNNKATLKDGEYVYDGKRRMSTELLFTLGKAESVYFCALATKDPSVLNKLADIHHQVMEQVVLPLITELAVARVQDQNNETKEQNGYEVACVDVMHIESRSVEPHIHFHSQLLNSLMAKDGRLFSLEAADIYDWKGMIDMQYQAAMKEALEGEFGVTYKKVFVKRDEINEHLKDHEKAVASYDLTSDLVPDEVVDYFSSRTKEIEKELEEKGLASTPEARAVAQKSTRSDKQELSPSEMLAQWTKDFASLGYSATPPTAPIGPKKQFIPIADEQLSITFQRKHHEQHAARAIAASTAGYSDGEGQYESRIAKKVQKLLLSDEQITRNFAERIGQVDFKLHQMQAFIGKMALDTCDGATALEEAQRISEEQCYLYLDPKSKHYSELKDFIAGRITDPMALEQAEILFRRNARFITKPVIEADKRIHEGCMARVGDTRFLIDKRFIASEIMGYEKEKGFQLSADQSKMVYAAFSEPGAVINTAGMAGAGKSTAAEVIVRILRKQGFEVIGTSISAEATKGLAKSAGLKKGESFNSAELLTRLDNGKLKLTEKTVVLFDEAGMADIFTLDRLFTHIHKAGAKVNLIGEKEQAQPIGPGNMFKHLNENFITVPLTSINRQNTVEKRENVKLWQAGQAQEAMEQFEQWGWLSEAATNKAAWEEVATRFVEDSRPDTQKIIMADTNADNDAINRLIKKKLQESGVLDPNAPFVAIKCADGVEREFGVGDRVTFFKKSSTANAVSADGEKDTVNNSQTGRVHGFRKNRLTGGVAAICLELDEIDPATKKNRLVYIDVKTQPKFRFGWSGTVYKAQGASVPRTFRVLTSNSQPSAFMEYVASSRYKDEHTIVLSKEFQDKIYKKVYDLEVSDKQSDRLEWLQKHKKIEVPSWAYESFGQADTFLQGHVEEFPEVKTPITDRYADLIKKLSEQPFKKNVADFEEVQDGLSFYRQIMQKRTLGLAQFRENRSALKPVAKPSQVKNWRDIPTTADIPKARLTRMEQAQQKKAAVIQKKKQKANTLSM